MEEGEDQRHDVIVRRLDPSDPLLSELGEREPVNPPTPATSLERRIAEGCDDHALVAEGGPRRHQGCAPA